MKQGYLLLLMLALPFAIFAAASTGNEFLLGGAFILLGGTFAAALSMR